MQCITILIIERNLRESIWNQVVGRGGSEIKHVWICMSWGSQSRISHLVHPNGMYRGWGCLKIFHRKFPARSLLDLSVWQDKSLPRPWHQWPLLHWSGSKSWPLPYLEALLHGDLKVKYVKKYRQQISCSFHTFYLLRNWNSIKIIPTCSLYNGSENLFGAAEMVLVLIF